jgi:hypothetical protein
MSAEGSIKLPTKNPYLFLPNDYDVFGILRKTAQFQMEW